MKLQVLWSLVCLVALLREANGFARPSIGGQCQQSWKLRRYPRHERQSTGYQHGRQFSLQSVLRANQKDDDSQPDPDSASSSLDNPDDSSPLPWIFGLVVPLWLVYISNQWSRSSLYYLVDFSSDADPLLAMNVDVGFSEAQYGVLASLAFTSLFAFASLAAGIISDRFNRKTLTVAACLVWAIATLGTSFSQDYSQVLGWRVAMGLACAFATPPAYTLIAQRVPKESVSLASSLYGTGVALGGAFASLSILLDTSVGWREALVIIGIYGFVVAGVATILLPNDPKDTQPEADTKFLVSKDTTTISTDESPVDAILADVQEATASDRVKWLFLGSFLRFCSGLCIGVWSAPYFRMIFPDQQSQYAVAQAAITAVGGSVSGLLGGSLADKISANAEEEGDADIYGRKLWIPVVGSALAAPAWYLAVENSQSFEVAMAWLATEYFVAECWFGPTISVLQKTVGPKIGGTSQGLFTLTGAVANVAPSILGYMYGQATIGQEQSSTELAGLLVAGVCFCYVSCAFCFAMSALSGPPTSTTSAVEPTKQ
ncbi:hydroxybenzoate transporter PcaK [Seminavis robusta]|uniref:Hydroxybenzoate transporter PcaK n=1 Tax=Seminavis robusta TaxID=568900 RepID=A0A9N8DYI9_9STRA|nr:hydroxybenzoate transporter PcaK [Seminavis robusta]|eukprot:Sro477_g150810.1 hydroxybenzoate transporter PcaK (544) ;mRNA; f:39568-41199